MAVQVHWKKNERFNPEGKTLLLRPMDPNSAFANIPGTSNPQEAFCAVYGDDHEATAEYIVRASALVHELAMAKLPLDSTLQDLIEFHRREAVEEYVFDTDPSN